MKARNVLIAVPLATLLGAGASRADDMKGKFSVALQVGTQSELAGDLLNPARGTLLGSPTIMTARRYRSVYKPTLRLLGVVGYGLGEKVEVIGRVSRYESPRGDEKQGVEAGTFGGKTMFAYFTGYEESSAELGVRYYLAPQARMKSFVGLAGGVRSTQAVVFDLSVPDAKTAVLNIPFTKKTTVPVYGIDIGFSFDVNENFFVGVDTGLRYQKAPDAYRKYPELGAIESDPRWTAPVAAVFGVKF